MAARPGAPCWVSLTTHDRRATEEFYGAVLGWSFEDGTLAPEFRVATEEGEPVAGISEAEAARRLPVRWTVFFLAEDADKSAERIAERGATVAVGPLDFGGGRAVLAADPSGASFGLWQGVTPRHWVIGTGQAPAALELHAPEDGSAALFYGSVFGWPEPEDGLDWRFATLRDDAVAGDPDPAKRPRWEVTFRTADLDDAVAAATGRGGTVLTPPRETADGRRAALSDPHGALFSLVEA
ncbi:VOC family protein [Streptomyces sp. NBC_01795]|uniref:VOC family protein n=1 Tax=unclassified Streptomyces TaxID=2593676 RepID=UPI002DDB89B7|nr:MULTISPECIES: VOC family protein [unclassified Streptomyces]WSA95934.1 VOC family protein [Streptomyces sp. NBC_01795]WSB80349.1 VOC family protein [Streptomyces sp. NBC_01775]WSS11440.1 VOC family protein [Streptomyces sp. NBC_01186]